MSTTEGNVMMRKRITKALGVAVAAASVALGLVMMSPAANAEPLSNGLDVTCNTVTDTHITCIIAGCPRVHGDYVVDAVHVMHNGYQSEYSFHCINGATAMYNWNAPPPITFGVQGCRKKDLEGDWCGPWADYTWRAPATPKPQAPADVQCPAGTVGQTCAPIPDVTNAIQASFGEPGLTSLDFNVTNTSAIEATCNYTATANSLNPLVPKKTTRQFNVPANGNHTETFSGAITGTTYNAVLSCKDASGKQKAELGHVTTSVTW